MALRDPREEPFLDDMNGWGEEGGGCARVGGRIRGISEEKKEPSSLRSFVVYNPYSVVSFSLSWYFRPPCQSIGERKIDITGLEDFFLLFFVAQLLSLVFLSSLSSHIRHTMRPPSRAMDRLLPRITPEGGRGIEAGNDRRTIIRTVASREYLNALSLALFGVDARDGRMLGFREGSHDARVTSVYDELPICRDHDGSGGRSCHDDRGTVARRGMFHVLDAPDFLDDYYTNLLDWSSRGQVAIALGNSVYTWQGEGTRTLVTTGDGEDRLPTAVSWSSDGAYLAIGTSAVPGVKQARMEVWDVDAERLVRKTLYPDRINVSRWAPEGGGGGFCRVLAIGGRDNQVILQDMRDRSTGYSRLNGHAGQICGLEWEPPSVSSSSSSGCRLVSGGNDNVMKVWEPAARRDRPLATLEGHEAAVKAIAWCPWKRNLLASGGGTADGSIRLWDLGGSVGDDTKPFLVEDCGSQVCGLRWSRTSRELVSAHGFSRNHLCLWSFSPRKQELYRMTDFLGHTARVTQMTQSPEGHVVCTGSGDETIRFWKMFEPQRATEPALPERRRVHGLLTASIIR